MEQFWRIWVPLSIFWDTNTTHISNVFSKTIVSSKHLKFVDLFPWFFEAPHFCSQEITQKTHILLPLEGVKAQHLGVFSTERSEILIMVERVGLDFVGKTIQVISWLDIYVYICILIFSCILNGRPCKRKVCLCWALCSSSGFLFRFCT